MFTLVATLCAAQRARWSSSRDETARDRKFGRPRTGRARALSSNDFRDAQFGAASTERAAPSAGTTPDDGWKFHHGTCGDDNIKDDKAFTLL